VPSKTWTVLARSKSAIVSSNPTQGMDVCVHLFCVCVVLSVGRGLATGWSPVQGVVLSDQETEKKLSTPNKWLWSHNNNNNCHKARGHELWPNAPCSLELAPTDEQRETRTRRQTFGFVTLQHFVCLYGPSFLELLCAASDGTNRALRVAWAAIA
jgi:hypothetical protein